jgi:hypothetical protein
LRRADCPADTVVGDSDQLGGFDGAATAAASTRIAVNSPDAQAPAA